MATINERLGACEVCGAKSAKYTCPKCEVKTCTLNCVNIHKKELDCDGIRDLTKYVPISKFTNLDLLSDYRMLENITRNVETMKKDKLVQFTRINKGLPKHLHLLKQALHEQQTTIEFLPQHFKRHKLNTTQLNYKTKIVHWRIEFLFQNAENFKIVEEKCDENLKLSTLIHNYFDPLTYKNDQLKFYQSSGLSGVEFYLKSETKPNKYYCLDCCLSLKEILRNKTVIEFPTIYVVLKNHANFDIVDSDVEDMEQMDPKSYVSAIVNAEDTGASKSNGKKKNMLFITGYSSDELSDDHL